MAEARDRMDEELQEALTERLTELATLNDEVSALMRQVASSVLSDVVEPLKVRVRALAEATGGVDERLRAIDEQIGGLAGSVRAIRTEFGEFGPRVEQVSGRVTDVESRLGGRLEDVGGRFETGLREHDARLDSLGTRLVDRLDAVDLRLEATAARVGEAASGLSGLEERVARAEAVEALSERMSEDAKVVRGLAEGVPPALDGVQTGLKTSLRKHGESSTRVEQIVADMRALTWRINLCLGLVGLLLLWNVVRVLWG